MLYYLSKRSVIILSIVFLLGYWLLMYLGGDYTMMGSFQIKVDRWLIGEGHMMITVIPEEGERYQGVVALDGDTLAACLEKYFAQSEQLPTRFSLTFGKSQMPGGVPHWRAGGMMLQHMPSIGGHREVAAEGGSGEGDY